MVLKKLQLKNFRIHADTEISFSDGLNLIVGGNGQGKTSIIEAIYFLCTTKNYKGAPDQEILRFGEQVYEIQGEFSDKTETAARIYYSLAENRRYYLKNGKQVSRAVDVIGSLPVVLLTPEDHAITQGAPADRRKFVDSVISQESSAYLQTLLDFNRTLKQRASLLFRLREEGTTTNRLAELDAWDERLAESGAELISYRQRFTDEFIPYLNDAYKKIPGSSELPKIDYVYLDGFSGSGIKDHYLSQLKERRNEEIRRGTNLTGPQKDEFVFSINGKSLRNFGSQGQHKTFQAALRFAQFFYLQERSGLTPILLLDDVFGELDAERSVKISEYLKVVGQAFVTITDFSNLGFIRTGGNDSVLHIKGGRQVVGL
ncbi:MAG: DNA replication/repair protein RecF [Ignavibacteriaceae bacterium]|nr:DNA replication/repair protein RecF [Ignavibacteriaceae bacterium]